jgi:hypothetical protein
VTDSRISFLLLNLFIKRFERSVGKDTRGLNDQDRYFSFIISVIISICAQSHFTRITTVCNFQFF